MSVMHECTRHAHRHRRIFVTSQLSAVGSVGDCRGALRPRLEEFEGTGREALRAFDAQLDDASAVLRQAGCAPLLSWQVDVQHLGAVTAAINGDVLCST